MNNCAEYIKAVMVFLILSSWQSAIADTASVSDAEIKMRLFAVQVTVGPNWDNEKATHEQVYFKEHSANLKRLRESGHIVMGARYSDLGLLIFTAPSVEDVRDFMSKDPSFGAGTFRYEVHALNVFYPWKTSFEDGRQE